MILPERKSQLRSGPTDFSHTYDNPCSYTLAAHFGQGPSAGLPGEIDRFVVAGLVGTALAEIELELVIRA
jgi:hypothetical protein